MAFRVLWSGLWSTVALAHYGRDTTNNLIIKTLALAQRDIYLDKPEIR